MAGKLLNIRITPELYDEIALFAKEEHFSSPQDFAKNALREKVRKLRLEQIRYKVQSLYGSSKTGKIATKKELHMLARKKFPVPKD